MPKKDKIKKSSSELAEKIKQERQKYFRYAYNRYRRALEEQKKTLIQTYGREAIRYQGDLQK